MKIKLHSIVDLITNSSTVIYTYSNGCEDALVDLFNELRKTFNIKEDITDIFYMAILCDEYIYEDYLLDISVHELDNENLEISKNILESLKDKDRKWKDFGDLVGVEIKNVIYNKNKKPKWMIEAENQTKGWVEMEPSTYIHIIPKEPKYEYIAKLFYKLIYSVNNDAIRDD